MCSVLLSGSGVVIAAHTCIKEQAKDITFYQPSDCCDSNTGCNSVAFNGIKCCNVEVNFYKIDLNTSVTSHEVKDVFFPIELAVFFQAFGFDSGSYTELFPETGAPAVVHSENFIFAVQQLLI